ILYNRETAILDNLEGGRFQHRGDEWEQSIEGCYRALHRAHVPVEFVDIDRLKKGLSSQFDVLYIPYCYAIDDEGMAALRSFVQGGGTLWADGLTAWKNAMGHLRPSIPGELADVFGFEATDIYPVKVDEPYSVTDGNELAGELWKLPLELQGADVVLRDKEGKPFATKHSFGKGKALYFESALTLAYAKRGNAQIQDWIVGPARASAAGSALHWREGSARISFRGLVHATGAIAILSNWGAEEQVTVAFEGDCLVSELLTDAAPQVHREGARTIARLSVPASGVAVIRAVKRVA
ncbi:MAG: beta-galactosidase trimerization domain-containing protein, partial [Acidobacteriota bacterium]|nr:beta-galactosidase trimerization domain-containing protein [Acidobacteriota bacterium]